MKFLLLLAPIFLFTAEPRVRIPGSIPITPEELPRKNLTYVNPGVTTVITSNSYGRRKDVIIMPDISVGIRNLSSHVSFDRAVGILIHQDVKLLYVQGSALFFPIPSEKLYGGIGLTLGISHLKNRRHPVFYGNLPFTVGYQFSWKHHYSFLQLQATITGSGTLSYGVGF